MVQANGFQAPEVDVNNLCELRVYSDGKLATITEAIPVTLPGAEESTEPRQAKYIGKINIITPGGMIPLQANLKAGSLAEAVEEFGQAMVEAYENFQHEVRKARSKIVVPQAKLNPNQLRNPNK